MHRFLEARLEEADARRSSFEKQARRIAQSTKELRRSTSSDLQRCSFHTSTCCSQCACCWLWAALPGTSANHVARVIAYMGAVASLMLSSELSQATFVATDSSLACCAGRQPCSRSWRSCG